MPQTITLKLDLFTAKMVRDCLRFRARAYGDQTIGHEHCMGLAEYLDEEIASSLKNLPIKEKVASRGVRSGSC